MTTLHEAAQRAMLDIAGSLIELDRPDLEPCPPSLAQAAVDKAKPGTPLGRLRDALAALSTAAPAGEPVQATTAGALHPVAKRRVFDAIRDAYDLGYNDARNARTIPGDSAPGYKGRDVETDHGGALIHALEAAPQPAQQAAAPGVARGGVDCIGLALDLEARFKTVGSQTTERAMRAAAHGLRLLAATPAPAAPTQAEQAFKADALRWREANRFKVGDASGIGIWYEDQRVFVTGSLADEIADGEIARRSIVEQSATEEPR